MSLTTRSFAKSLAVSLALASPALAELELPRPSPQASVTQKVGLTDVSITYSRPGVKGRTIWGDLVPYDEVWRTGANEATIITFSDDVTINGQALAKGTYSLHTLPGRDAWSVIFNNVAEQWGSYSYDAKNDALRVAVKPRAGAFTEWMTFEFPKLAVDSAEVVLRWEKLEVPFTVGTDTLKRGLANIEQALKDNEADRARIPQRAADFHFQAKDYALALTWIEKSIAAQPSYFNQNLKARMLAEQGKKADAIATLEKALASARAEKLQESIWKPGEKMLAAWKASM